MRKINLIALTIIGMLAGCNDNDAADQKAIRQVMLKTWDRPQNRLEAGPIAVSGDRAVADWSQGQRGGRALFARRDGEWVVTLCGGEGLRTETGLMRAGISKNVAEELANELRMAERAVPAERLAKMASFAGEIRMDGPHQQ